MEEFILDFIMSLQEAGWFEWLCVLTGLLSVWYSKNEVIWVYPVGMINTIGYIIISIQGQLPGEAILNLYYTVLSIIGWIKWSRRDGMQNVLLRISKSRPTEIIKHFQFFIMCYLVLFAGIVYFKKLFMDGAIPAADAMASATAFTAMWLMIKKKIESWWWWIVSNIVSIPLYAVKGYALSAIYYLILLGLAIAGLYTWKQKAKRYNA
jgi:nicotinamide mononucleotide transporter